MEFNVQNPYKTYRLCCLLRGVTGKYLKKEAESIVFITVPRKVNNFCAGTNKASENLGKKKFLQFVENHLS